MGLEDVQVEVVQTMVTMAEVRKVLVQLDMVPAEAVAEVDAV